MVIFFSFLYYLLTMNVRRNGVVLIVNKRVQNVVLRCNLKNNRMTTVHFQGKSFNTTVIQVYVPTTAAAAKSLQLCLTLCHPIDGSPPGSAVPGILQARTLEWATICFSKAWKWKVKMKLLSHVWLLATPWTVAYQAPLSMGFSRQEYWSGVSLPSPMYQLVMLKKLKLNGCMKIYKTF